MLQSLVAAEQLVDPHVIAGVVAVIGSRLEYRTEIERIDSERLYIVKPVGDSPEVAAEEDVVGDISAGNLGVLRDSVFPVAVYLAAHMNLAGAREAVGEYLVHHRAPEPCGGFEILVVDHELSAGRRVFVGRESAVAVHPEPTVDRVDPEDVVVESDAGSEPVVEKIVSRVDRVVQIGFKLAFGHIGVGVERQNGGSGAEDAGDLHGQDDSVPFMNGAGVGIAHHVR